jgi:serine/threonine protein kinase
MSLPSQPGLTHYFISKLANRTLEHLLRASFDEKLRPGSAREIEPRENWLRQQVYALAEALATIHSPGAESAEIHHDIKPANIFVFENKADALKFTDWGCPDFMHVIGTGSPTCTHRGIPPHLPPKQSGSRATSRAHDSPSLGCVFTKMLVWATQGVEFYKDFDRAADRQQAHVCWYSVQDDGKTILGDTVALILNQFESRELG